MGRIHRFDARAFRARNAAWLWMSWAPSLALDVVLAFRWASGFSPGSPALEWAGLFAANALLLKSPGACAYLVRRWLARRSFVEVGPRAVTYRRRRLA